MVIHKALLLVRDKPVGQVVIIRHSLTALQRIQGDVKDALTHDITQEQTLSVLRVTLQWIGLPAHCQVHGNEVADALAKSGGRLEQVEQPASYPASKTLINAA